MFPTLIIAEAGVNHNGSKDLALKLIEIAADAGADIIKFQTFRADKLASKLAFKAAYQAENLQSSDNSQQKMLRSLELPESYYKSIINHCLINGIRFLSTGFDEESIDFIDSLNVPLFKIPSGEITNKPYLEHIAGKGKPVIMSTGMATIEEINNAFSILIKRGLPVEKITLLHCSTAYPTPYNEVNLKAMLDIKERFGVNVGYSDHTLGIEVPIAAVALGATVIEKHFTIDRNLPGPDHMSSLEPEELRKMVRAIRNIEAAISGTGKKSPGPLESENKDIVRKSIHIAVNIAAGTEIQPSHLIMKRPGNGISPMEIDNILGKKTKRVLLEDTLLKWEDLE